MNGFSISAIGDWFSEENLERQQVRLKEWWETNRKAGLSMLLKSAAKQVFKWLFIVTLVVVAITLAVQGALEDQPVLLLAMIPVGLIFFRQWELASEVVAIIGLIGCGAFAANLFGLHVEGIYAGLLAIIGVAAYRIDVKAIYIIAVYFVLAYVIKIVINLIGIPLGIALGGWPANGITHVIWILLAVVAIGVAFKIATRLAAVLVTVMFAAVGYSYFLWGYAGIRWQEQAVFGQLIYPDQLVYGSLLLVVAAVLFKTRSRAVNPAEAETVEQPGAHPDQAALLERLYELDKQERVFRNDWKAFLAKALQKLQITQEQLDQAGIKMHHYHLYAAQRAIDEIRKSGHLTKKGTVHPTKLAKLGFRPDFLGKSQHNITPEELLTGKLRTN